MHEDPPLRVSTTEFARGLVTRELTSEVSRLAEKESGWHVSAINPRAEQFDDFAIDGMSRRMQEQAPVLSTLLGALLDSDRPRIQRQRQFSEEQVRSAVNSNAAKEDVTWDEEDEYWWDADLDAERLRKRCRRAAERRDAVLQIRQVVITSVLMFSTNQKCNALAAAMGMFFHSTSTPELVVEVFSHAGLSISITTIHKMVSSLSKSASDELRKLAKAKTLGFAYDNFDMDFKSWSATIENSGDTLKHATSALAFPLEHDVTPEDLKCAASLWSTSPLNPCIPPEQCRPVRTWLDLQPHPSEEPAGRKN
ncbi:hypothetical protein BC835DRAFT_1284353 [Cytidiella melzeri]|nr:hypothetical protein BC835DRAFT_1284353 [Cytidiella melzeri]